MIKARSQAFRFREKAFKNGSIKIFQDRIEFFNPGGLPEGVSMDELLSGRLASHPRNKQIAAIFKEAGIIEKYGSGIKRVRKVMADAGAADPIFEIVSDCFKVTLMSEDLRSVFNVLTLSVTSPYLH